MHGLRKDTRRKAARRLPGAPTGAAKATPGASGVPPAALAPTLLWKTNATWPAPYNIRPLGSIEGSGPRRVGGCAFGGGTGASSSAEACDQQRGSRGSLTSMRRGFLPFEVPPFLCRPWPPSWLARRGVHAKRAAWRRRWSSRAVKGILFSRREWKEGKREGLEGGAGEGRKPSSGHSLTPREI